MRLFSCQKGFTPILILIIVAVLVLGGGLFFVSKGMFNNSQLNQQIASNSRNPNTSSQTSASPLDYIKIMTELGCTSQSSCMAICQKPENAAKCQSLFQQFGGQGPNRGNGGQQGDPISSELSQYSSRNILPSCNGNTLLTRAPADPGTYKEIFPLGNVSSNGGNATHVVPTDHLYFINPVPNTTQVVSEAQASTQGETIPVFAPADVQIVEVDAHNYIDTSHNINNSDYSIYFTPCKDVVFYFHHVTDINPAITDAMSQATGQNKQCFSTQRDGITAQSCNYFNLQGKLNVGDKIGTGSFDFGMYDFRQTPAAFINQAKATTLFAACPLDYFSEPVKTQLYKSLANTKTNASGLPDCGTYMQDQPGTVQGNWYLPNTQDQNSGGAQDGNELSVIHFNLDPSTGLIAWGGSITSPSQLHFKPSNTGTVNREPSQVTQYGQIYCYQGPIGLKDEYETTAPLTQIDGHVLLELVDTKTLKAEYGKGSCPSTSSFSSPTTYFR